MVCPAACAGAGAGVACSTESESAGDDCVGAGRAARYRLSYTNDTYEQEEQGGDADAGRSVE